MGWEFIWAEFNIRSLPYHSLAALDEATELFLHLVFETDSYKAQDGDGREGCVVPPGCSVHQGDQIWPVPWHPCCPDLILCECGELVPKSVGVAGNFIDSFGILCSNLSHLTVSFSISSAILVIFSHISTCDNRLFQ